MRSLIKPMKRNQAKEMNVNLVMKMMTVKMAKKRKILLLVKWIELKYFNDMAVMLLFFRSEDQAWNSSPSKHSATSSPRPLCLHYLFENNWSRCLHGMWRPYYKRGILEVTGIHKTEQATGVDLADKTKLSQLLCNARCTFTRAWWRAKSIRTKSKGRDGRSKWQDKDNNGLHNFTYNSKKPTGNQGSI